MLDRERFTLGPRVRLTHLLRGATAASVAPWPRETGRVSKPPGEPRGRSANECERQGYSLVSPVYNSGTRARK